MIQPIHTTDAPAPGGHYSQAINYCALIFVSGQLAVNPTTGEKMLGSIEEQTAQVLENMRQILLAAGSDIDCVLKTTLYVSDINLWGRVNKVYADFFGEHKPARSVVPVKELHYGFQIELEAIAVKKQA